LRSLRNFEFTRMAFVAQIAASASWVGASAKRVLCADDPRIHQIR
jgi:hypothetical protein